MIDWTNTDVLKIGNELYYEIDSTKVKSQREKIEPWLTAIFQSEHVSLLLGSGITIAVSDIADVDSQDMSRIGFSYMGERIKEIANEQAIRMGRKEANIEDDFRVALELCAGLKIYNPDEAEKLQSEIDEKLLAFIQKILGTERAFLNSEKMQTALKYLKSFLFSFASRTATRDRLNIFTTNYDRFIEYACDSAGILILDRFVGKIAPTFRTNKLDLDYHYNPPGIRGEPRYVEGVIRFTKLHGSLDWKFNENKILKTLLPFGAEQEHPSMSQTPSLQSVIYPNASKGIETIYYPYSELLRDFSCAVSQPNSAVITFGYGFGDSHINKILEDMLNIPSTHIVIISYNDSDGRIQEFVERNNYSQFSLLIGNHLGNLTTLVDSYLPKAAIDRITERQHQIIEKRGALSNQEMENREDAF